LRPGTAHGADRDADLDRIGGNQRVLTDIDKDARAASFSPRRECPRSNA
jgi:hypothetical protein